MGKWMNTINFGRDALAKKLLRAVGTLATFIGLACAALPASAQILGNGYAVVACRPTSFDPVTLAIKDITQFGTLWQTPANQGPTIDWSSNMPAGMEFTTGDFGGHEVFSTTISTPGDIYTVTTTLYNIGHGATLVMAQSFLSPFTKSTA